MKKIIYIIAPSRSGSTLLDLILSSNSKCASLGELFRYKISKCGLCGVNCKYWDYFKKKKHSDIYKVAFRKFKKPILIDSSKRVAWAKRFDNSDYAKKYIRLTRNGLDRLFVYKRRFGVVTENNVKGWMRNENRIDKYLNGKKHFTISYEDIFNHSRMISLCNFIGIKFKANMYEYWKHKHHGILGSATAYSLVRNYHNYPLEKEHKEFLARHGMKTSKRVKIDFLSMKEKEMFKCVGGETINRKLGYK